MYTVLAIAAGGATGAVLRHFCNSAVMGFIGGGFPWGIMAINILGSLVMGLLTGLFAHFYDPGQTAKAFLTVGLLGGFTTFSSFSLDAVLLVERGAMLEAAAYVAVSVGVSLAALFGGLLLMRAVAP
jgi:CrcB protein